MKKQESFSKRIAQTLRSGRNKYFRRSDKKTFWIQNEETTPFIQIDGEDFFTADEIQERFGVSRTVLFNQLCKKRTHFLDSQEKSHEVELSPSLEKFLSFMRAAVANASSQKRKKNANMAENKSMIEEFQNLF